MKSKYVCTIELARKTVLLIWFMSFVLASPTIAGQVGKQLTIVQYILEINENATLVFSISFHHGLIHHNFVFIRQLYFTYSIKRPLFVLIDCQYALLKSTCSKTNYLAPCNVPHE